MDYELLHEVSLIDREILKLERTKIDKEIIKELNTFKNKHKILKAHYEDGLNKQYDLNQKTKNMSKLIEEKTKEKKEYEDNLYSTNNTKAIDICQDNVDKLNLEIKELEDNVYEMINKSESISLDNAKLVTEINEVRAIYNDILKKYKKHQDEFDTKISSMLEKRNNYIKNVEIESRKIYEDIKQEHGFGMSEMKGVICTGCNVDVPVVIINEIKYSKKLIKCPNCGRLLYAADINMNK